MQFRNPRSLPLLVVMILVVDPIITYALSVQKNAYSIVGNPWWAFWLDADEIMAQSYGTASNLRLWSTDHYIHSHSGDGYAYARVANESDSDTGSFYWYISS